MLEIKAKLKMRRDAYAVDVTGRLELTFDKRQKSRLRAQLDSGEDVALDLPRGELLRGGDLVVASDGRIVEIVAQLEQVVHAVCADAAALARAAYHLGNRHVPVQVGAGFLRIAADHVLEDMLQGLGATLERMQAPFEPEAGAYAGGHHHHDEGGEGGGAARIHEFGAAHDHGHDHHDRDTAHRGHDHHHAGDHGHEH